jgi:hypothetical protein
MVVGQIHSGFGNQRHQAGNEIQWFEQHMCGAVEADFKSSGNPAGNLQLATCSWQNLSLG